MPETSAKEGLLAKRFFVILGPPNIYAGLPCTASIFVISTRFHILAIYGGCEGLRFYERECV